MTGPAAIMVGKGPSLDGVAWAALPAGPVVVGINEAAMVAPRCIGVAQDVDVFRRLATARGGRPVVQWAPEDYHRQVVGFLPPPWLVDWYRLCDAPKAATACVAMWLLRRRYLPRGMGGRFDEIACIGFDRYWYPEAPPDPERVGVPEHKSRPYAGAVEAIVDEPIRRSFDYALVNKQIARWADDLGFVLTEYLA